MGSVTKVTSLSSGSKCFETVIRRAVQQWAVQCIKYTFICSRRAERVSRRAIRVSVAGTFGPLFCHPGQRSDIGTTSCLCSSSCKATPPCHYSPQSSSDIPENTGNGKISFDSRLVVDRCYSVNNREYVYDTQHFEPFNVGCLQNHYYYFHYHHQRF